MPTDAQIRTLEKRIDRLESRMLDVPVLRMGSYQVKAGVNFVPFDRPLPSNNYSLAKPIVRISNTEEDVCNVKGKAKQGFTVFCPTGGTIEYVAVYNV